MKCRLKSSFHPGSPPSPSNPVNVILKMCKGGPQVETRLEPKILVEKLPPLENDDQPASVPTAGILIVANFQPQCFGKTLSSIIGGWKSFAFVISFTKCEGYIWKMVFPQNLTA